MTDRTSRHTGNDAPTDAAPQPGTPVRTVTTLVGRRFLPQDSSVGQALSKGYAEAMSRGIELALTLVIFGAVGWLFDRWVGTSPLFTLIFSLLGFAGITAKLFLGYDRDMAALAEGAIWNRGSLPVDGDVDRVADDPLGDAAGTPAPAPRRVAS